MDSPSQWQAGAREQDALPSTSAFVAPGQENFFLLHGHCLDSSPGPRRAGSVPASPSQFHSVQSSLVRHGGYPDIPSYLTIQEPPIQTTASPSNSTQHFSNLYQMPSLGFHQRAPNLAALDLATLSHSPGHGALQSSPSHMFSSPTTMSHGVDPGMAMYGMRHPYLSYDAASQYGSQQQLQRLQHPGQQQHPSMHANDPRASAAATTAAAAAGPGPAEGAATAGSLLPNHLYGLPPVVIFPPYLQQQQQQHHTQHQSGSPLSQQQQQEVLALRGIVPDSFASPPPGIPPHQSPMGSGGGGGSSGVMQQQQPGALTERGPGAMLGGPDAAGNAIVTAVAAAAVAKVGPRAQFLTSPQSPAPGGFPAAVASGGMHGGAVRHVVEQLRTSPLVQSSDYPPAGEGGTPGRGGGGGTRGLTGGSSQAFGSGDKNVVAVQRYQAQILALERQNTELHKRLAETQAALDAARQSRQALEAKQDAMVDQVAQANQNAKSRESALESARRANDALSGELRSCQEELAATRNALAAAKDTAVQWQDRTMEVGKDLEGAKKKIETLGEEERRLSSENMALRKEVQQLTDVAIKGRIESAELREKLRSSQQETARAASTAQALLNRVESDQEGAAAQMSLMRTKMAELESRNSQLLYDMDGLREEVARARQAADAAKAALSAKPAGIASDGPASLRQHHFNGLGSSSWMMAQEAQAPGGGVPGGSGGAHATYHAAGSGGGGPYGGGIGTNYGTNNGGVGCSKPPFCAPVYGGGSGGGGSSGAGGGSGSGGGSSSGASGRTLLPPPPPLPPPTATTETTATGVFPASVSHSDQGTAAAILRDLPPDVAFSKLDPETFRTMVRAEAMARGGGGGAGGLYGGVKSPLKPSYGTRFNGGDLAAEPSVGAVGGAMPPPPRTAWGDGSIRDLTAATAPPPDARGMWGTGLSMAEDRKFVGAAGSVGTSGSNTAMSTGAGNNSFAAGRAVQPQGGGMGRGGGGGSPPPYAVNVIDSSYAYRRPGNAVGSTAVGGPGGGNGGTGAAHTGDTPYGTEETVKDMMARSKALEDQLMVLCGEKGSLEAEYARMPLGAGRSLRERNRKQVVEQRLELLNKEISSVRMQLKRLGVK